MGTILAIIDNDAREIGVMYARSRDSLIGAVLERHECGRRLADKREAMRHGEWTEWMRRNGKELGFGQETARRLIVAYQNNPSLTRDLTEEQAKSISQKMWGNARDKPKAIASPKPGTIIEIEDEDGEEEEEVPSNQLPTSMRIRGFMHRAKEAREMAEADDMAGIKTTDAMRDAARSAAEAWIKALANLEGE